MLSHCENTFLPRLYTDDLFTDHRQTKCYTTTIPKFNDTNQLSTLAETLQKNWTEQIESEPREMDDSLTNLNWLHNVTNIIRPESPSLSLFIPVNGTQRPNSAIFATDNCHSQKHTEYHLSHSQTSLTHHLDTALKDGGLLDPIVRYDYKNNWSGKPPFSYATLICMAMRELNKTKITLADIYGWITDNFIYYRLSDSSWQNSVRHNLSLNKCFEKVPRNKDERGKGGFWRINPKYADRLESNLIKYRRQFPVYCIPKISNGLPAASTILSRDPSNLQELYQIFDCQHYPDPSATTDDIWQNPNYRNTNDLRDCQLVVPNDSWVSKNKSNYIPNQSTGSYSTVDSPCAFNNSIQNDCSSIRKHCLKIPSLTYRNPGLVKLQSLDEFRTSEHGRKVDTQFRADLTPNMSPTMYSLLQQINSSPSDLSLDDVDSAASSSFDTDVTANSGSCVTYHSHSDDHDDLLRFTSGLGDEFMAASEDYLTCDSLRHQDNIFSSFI